MYGFFSCFPIVGYRFPCFEAGVPHLVYSSLGTDGQGGSTQYLSLKEGGVSLTDFSVIKEALGDKFPQDIVDKCKELEQKIISGEIKVQNYEGFGPK